MTTKQPSGPRFFIGASLFDALKGQDHPCPDDGFGANHPCLDWLQERWPRGLRAWRTNRNYWVISTNELQFPAPILEDVLSGIGVESR